MSSTSSHDLVSSDTDIDCLLDFRVWEISESVLAVPGQVGEECQARRKVGDLFLQEVGNLI